MKIIGIIVSAVLVIGVLVWVLLPSDAPVPADTGVPLDLPVAGDASIPRGTEPGSGYALAGTDGSAISVTNFLKDAHVTPDPVNPGYFFLSATTSQPFMVVYIAATQYFIVDLLEEPLGESRRAAQQYLMELLGATDADLCRLNYSVSTSYRVNTSYAGTNLGFSGCPGAITLPE